MKKVLKKIGKILGIILLVVMIIAGCVIKFVVNYPEIKNDPTVVKITEKYGIGSKLEDWKDIRNSSYDIAMLCDNLEIAKQKINKVYDTFKVIDEYGEDMRVAKFNPIILDKYVKN